MIDKILVKITGIILVMLSIVMIYFAIYFWYQDETAIIALASLYIALVLSVVIASIGLTFIADKNDKGGEDE